MTRDWYNDQEVKSEMLHQNLKFRRGADQTHKKWNQRSIWSLLSPLSPWFLCNILPHFHMWSLPFVSLYKGRPVSPLWVSSPAQTSSVCVSSPVCWQTLNSHHHSNILCYNYVADLQLALRKTTTAPEQSERATGRKKFLMFRLI